MALSRISTSVLKNIPCRHASALFIPGNKATDCYSFLSPILDFDDRFADIKKLEYQLHCRKIPVDVAAIKESWDFYKSIDHQRHLVEVQREELAQKIKKVKKTGGSIEELKTQGAILRQDLKIIKEQLWKLEETVIVNVLNLPNDLDEKTPMEPVVLRTQGRKTLGTSKSHLELGLERHLVEFLEPMCYYLTNEAALVELAATRWAAGYFLDTIRVSGTDFARDFVVEASGTDHTDPRASFLLEQSNHDDKILGKLHLVGGSSLIAFLSMHTKQLINPKSLPLRYHSVGRNYFPTIGNSTPTVGKADLGLFWVAQATNVDCFTLSKASEATKEFSKLVEVVTRVYDDLGVHYRIVLRAADELKPWESLKVSFEMWSRHRQEYVEVGHLATHGNYFSKRLLIAFQTNNGRDYPSAISGTVLSVSNLIGCLIEDSVDFIPSVIKRNMVDVL
ncbi:GSCOCG00008624001-RA-CDS [Cotesia congregata]|uniref:serine--tRNA ligase n=1 Tax=Cotesia congregata TaxID=51543 RepID=A0A8J2EA42_COTCN|nr:GSCOCG00008624001-RA-CDS [Cotesia congregata]CAG5074973.1 Similar to Slimp: Serine--tRNA synthetase-like protein Slimp (Drosophila melanogaster) [Cotesia congregata]